MSDARKRLARDSALASASRYSSRRRRWRVLIGVDRNVGRADQRIVIVVRDHEHDAVIGILQDVRMLFRMDPRHDDVAALDVPHVAFGGALRTHDVEDLFTHGPAALTSARAVISDASRRRRSASRATLRRRAARRRSACAREYPRRALARRARWRRPAARRRPAHPSTRSPSRKRGFNPAAQRLPGSSTPNDLGSVIRPPM